MSSSSTFRLIASKVSEAPSSKAKHPGTRCASPSTTSIASTQSFASSDGSDVSFESAELTERELEHYIEMGKQAFQELINATKCIGKTQVISDRSTIPGSVISTALTKTTMQGTLGLVAGMYLENATDARAVCKILGCKSTRLLAEIVPATEIKPRTYVCLRWIRFSAATPFTKDRDALLVEVRITLGLIYYVY